MTTGTYNVEVGLRAAVRLDLVHNLPGHPMTRTSPCWRAKLIRRLRCLLCLMETFTVRFGEGDSEQAHHSRTVLDDLGDHLRKVLLENLLRRTLRGRK